MNKEYQKLNEAKELSSMNTMIFFPGSIIILEHQFTRYEQGLILKGKKLKYDKLTDTEIEFKINYN